MRYTLHQRACMHEPPDDQKCPVCNEPTDQVNDDYDGLPCGGRCVGCNDKFCNGGWGTKYCAECVAWARGNQEEAVPELLEQMHKDDARKAKVTQ